MKILLVNVSTYRKVYVYPIGLDYLKSYLESNGFSDIETLDLALVPESLHKQELIQKLSVQFDVIAFSFRNITDQLHHGRQYTPVVKDLIDFTRQVVRGYNHQTTLVVGGAGFSLLPEKMIELVGADYGISGEGEVAFLQLLHRLKKNLPTHQKIFFSKVPLAEIEYTRGSWGYVDEYQGIGAWGNIQSKRGCNRKCVYCSYPVIEGKMFRLRDPDLVAKEALQLEKLGFTQLYFVDATFNNPLMHGKEILKSFKKYGVTASWKGFFNPDIDQELLNLVKETNGDQIIRFTIESGSDKMLQSLQKGFTVEYIEKAIALCKKNNMQFAFTVMFGAPGETRETILETCRFINKHQPVHVSAGFGVFIYPQTPLAELTKGTLWNSEEELLFSTQVPFEREENKRLIESELSKAGVEFIIYDEIEFLNQSVM